jgi:NAD+ synthase (glutamine-hydrolysing)
MKDGFIRVAAATPVVRVGDPVHNAASMIELVREAVRNDAKLILFPELCLTAYTCGDLFLQPTLLNGALTALFEIAAETRGLDVLIVAGLPVSHCSKLYNCAAVLFQARSSGSCQGNIPYYTEFTKRGFSPGPDYETDFLRGRRSLSAGPALLLQPNAALRFGIEICEGLWVRVPRLRTSPDRSPPSFQPSASVEIISKPAYRRSLVSSSRAASMRVLYADAGIANPRPTGFPGHNLIAENGTLLPSPGCLQTAPFSDLDLTA